MDTSQPDRPMRAPLPFQRLALAGFAAVLAIGALLSQTGFITDADRNLLDAAFRYSRIYFPEKVTVDPIIVGIDEKFIAGIEEPMALNHAYLTRFLQAMGQAGPSVVGLDIELPDKRYETLVSTRDQARDYHKTLLTGLLQAVPQTRIIAAKVWDAGRRSYHEIHLDYAVVLGMQAHQPAMASAMFGFDADNRVRRYPEASLQPDGTPHTLTSEMSAAIGIRQNWSGLINYRLGGAFTYIPLQDVLKWAEDGDSLRLRANFAGKPVLLGIVLEDMDILDLPVPLSQWRGTETRVPGVLAHAQVLRSIWNQGLIRTASNWLALPITALFALFWFGESIILKLRLLMAVSLALLIVSGILFLQNYWLPPTAMLATGMLGFGGRSIWQGWRHFKEKQRLNRMFSGSVSPSVMQEIVAGGLDVNQKSSRLPVCVLFADIRNFTTMCEHMQAEDVVSLLNRYFARMVSVIHRHEGTVDKFIGDGLMAFFGAPNKLACPEQHALDAARDMVASLEELNREFADEGRPQLQIGVGLHSGEAVIGQIGSAERHEYTAIGDAVNTASRIEGLCKEAGYPIVCSETVARAVHYPAMLNELGERALKGRSAIRVYGWNPQRGAAGSSHAEQPAQSSNQLLEQRQ